MASRPYHSKCSVQSAAWNKECTQDSYHGLQENRTKLLAFQNNPIIFFNLNYLTLHSPPLNVTTVSSMGLEHFLHLLADAI